LIKCVPKGRYRVGQTLAKMEAALDCKLHEMMKKR